MSMQAWPFLVGHNRTLGHRSLIVPQFLLDLGEADLLIDAVRGDVSKPGQATYREIHSSSALLGEICLIFRQVRVKASDIGLQGEEILHDQSSRAIRLSEGIVIQGLKPDIIVTRNDFLFVHEQAMQTYRDFWKTTQGIFAFTPSTIIKIATDFPTAGLERVDGMAIQDGIDMAIKEANRNNTIPGYTLEPVYKDDTGKNNVYDPQVGAKNVTDVTNDNLVAGIIGPLNSNVAHAEIPITSQAQAPIALISPGNTNPCLTRSDAASGCSGTRDILPQLYPNPNTPRTYFRLPATDDLQGKDIADYLFYKQT